LRLRDANRVEIYFFALGGLFIVGIFIVEEVWVRSLGLRRIKKRIVPHPVAGSRSVDYVVGSALEKVADRQIEGKVVSLLRQ
jgi:hypothetical protein